MILNGQQIQIRPNLHDCLMHLWKLLREVLRENKPRATQTVTGAAGSHSKPLWQLEDFGLDFAHDLRHEAHAYIRHIISGYPRPTKDDHDKTALPRLTLWIDAVCINQNDISERNHQVLLMGDIYRGATTVLSWLGSHPELVRGLWLASLLAHIWTTLDNTAEEEEDRKKIKNRTSRIADNKI